MYTGIFIESFIHNSPRLETDQVFINRQKDKQATVNSYNGILFSYKKEGTTDATE